MIITPGDWDAYYNLTKEMKQQMGCSSFLQNSYFSINHAHCPTTSHLITLTSAHLFERTVCQTLFNGKINNFYGGTENSLPSSLGPISRALLFYFSYPPSSSETPQVLLSLQYLKKKKY